MKMLKTLALTVLAPTLIKAVEEGYEWICNQFNDDEPEPGKVKVINLQSPDRTVLTPPMKRRIIREHNSYLRKKETTDGMSCDSIAELTMRLNMIFRINKSMRSYSRVWNKK